MKVVRSDWLLIALLIILGAIPSLVGSNAAFLGTNQDTGEPIPLEEFKADDLPIMQIAADRPAESNIITADNPFNAFVVEWTQPNDPFFFLEARTGSAEGEWADWVILQPNADLTLPHIGFMTSDMFFVGDGSSTHTQVQLRSSLPSVIKNVRITFIDSTEGPTTQEWKAAQADLTASLKANSLVAEDALANPKPEVISRDVWCTSELCRPDEGNSGNACVDSDRLRYANVSHLVVHHTVTSNAATNWAPVVRAIWQYHAFSRCWGDIGYNYLVDPQGNIYEGHRGGDNVIGTHAGNINSDSMGVALLGTFTEPGPPYNGIKPPPAMADSLVDLLTWKADQENIDPWDSSYADSLRSGRPNLMGHRDAHGTTSCPGEQAHGMLPEIRQRVAARLDFVPDRIYVDELSSGFERSDANWYTGKYSCGFNGNAWFTFSTTNPAEAVNNGTWSFQVPTDGFYVVESMVPFCNTGEQETSSAPYQVRHARGTTDVVINQNDHLGLWAKLGSYEFKAGETYTVYLSDLTSDSGNGIWFDAIRLTPATGDDIPQPEFTLVSPADGDWVNEQTVDFEWDFDVFFGPQQWSLKLSTTEDMQSVVEDVTLTSGVTETSVTLDQPYEELFWQVEVLGLTSAEADPEDVWQFGIDTSPPKTDITSIIQRPDGSYRLLLSGEDSGSGLTSYTVEYRVFESRAVWSLLAEDTSDSVIGFTPSDNSVYEFRVTGVDAAGNVEVVEDVAKGSTQDVVVLEPVIFFPYIVKP